MSDSNHPVNVVLGADDGYAMQLGVTLYSVLKNINHRTCLNLFVLDGGISDKNRNKILNVFEVHKNDNHSIKWIKPDLQLIKKLPLQGKPPSVYLPLLIPDCLPSQCSKAIFLDSDVILETDITLLNNSDMEGIPLWAVQDFLVQTHSSNNGIEHYKKMGGRAESPYFNSGVMLINVDFWRRKNISQKAREYQSTYKESVNFHDQEALNAVLVDQWECLDPSWNQQGCIFWPQVLPDSNYTTTLLEMHGDLIQNPNIIHYQSSSKPWNYKCMHPYVHRFLFYLKESGWFTKTEWMRWWYKFYFRRLKWLLGDLRRTLNMVRFNKKEPSGIQSQINFG